MIWDGASGPHLFISRIFAKIGLYFFKQIPEPAGEVRTQGHQDDRNEEGRLAGGSERLVHSRANAS
jgi:hypothetical protein